MNLPSGLPPTQEKPSSKIAPAFCGDEALVALGGGGLLLLVEELDHLHQDLGVREQIGADLGVQRVLVGAR